MRHTANAILLSLCYYEVFFLLLWQLFTYSWWTLRFSDNWAILDTKVHIQEWKTPKKTKKMLNNFFPWTGSGGGDGGGGRKPGWFFFSSTCLALGSEQVRQLVILVLVMLMVMVMMTTMMMMILSWWWNDDGDDGDYNVLTGVEEVFKQEPPISN